MPIDEHDQIPAAAIARLAGVGRAAVSNWRRRYPDFPEPVGGSRASPTFSVTEVEAWLKATGKADQLATAGRTSTGTQRINGLTRSQDTVSDTWRRSLPREMPERAIADLTAGELLARAMVSLLPRSIPSAQPADGDDADLAAVLDPACSSGTLLMAVADRFGGRVKLAGQEILENAAAVAAFNLRDNAHGADYEVHVGDSLVDNQLSTYL